VEQGEDEAALSPAHRHRKGAEVAKFLAVVDLRVLMEEAEEGGAAEEGEEEKAEEEEEEMLIKDHRVIRYVM